MKELTLILAPLYTLRLSGDKLCVVNVSGKLCFWDKSSATFELCTASGELDVICWASDMAVERTFDAGTTVFTLWRNKCRPNSRVTGIHMYIYKDGQIEDVGYLQFKTILSFIGIDGFSCQQHFWSQLKKKYDRWVCSTSVIFHVITPWIFTWCPAICESRGIPIKILPV